MPMRTLRSEAVWTLVAVTSLWAGCAGPAETAGSTPAGVGRVEASLVSTSSAASPGKPLKVKEITVTVAKVTAHSNTAGWTTLSSKEVTVDLLKLAQFTQSLGFANMPAGKVTQVRLYVAEGKPQYVVRDDGVKVDLKVPSGLQSGIKLQGVFDVEGCALTSVPIEIDGKKSIWVHPTGQQDEWILRPVIRMGKIEASAVGCTPPNTTPVPVPPVTVNPGTGGGGGFDEGPGNQVPGGLPVNGAGGTCATGLNCLSGVCSNGTCGKGGPDAPCALALDCLSGVCGAGTCGIGKAGGTGTVCAVNAECLSNGCVNGVCGQGGQGQPCALEADCAVGFACVGGSCGSPIN